MESHNLTQFLNTTLGTLSLPRETGYSLYEGKVRDVVNLGNLMVIATSDRISAFDRVLGTIPCKGQVLNELSLFWFDKTADIVKNHVVEKLSARSILVKSCQVLPIEVVVRGYLTGSAWRDYSQGKPVSGIVLAPGMKANQKFETPILTPSTKEAKGKHDMPIASSQVVKQGIVKKDLWEQVERTALALFARGTEIAAQNGLILVDTKYEFGVRDNELYLVDEIHTPDSSRYWYADTYADLFTRGEKQRELDKEYLRQWLMAQGFMGDGAAPRIPDDIRLQVADRYITAYETITGRTFEPSENGADDEMRIVLQAIARNLK